MMVRPEIPARVLRKGVAFLTDPGSAGTPVRFAFSERTGGVSPQPWASLNMGGNTADDPANVRENKRRLFDALGARDLLDTLVRPGQVHGSAVACITPSSPDPEPWVGEACDAVVCTVPDRAVLLVFADCVPVVLAAPRGFAVVHSGWRGTKARIAALALDALCRESGCAPDEAAAYIGPHIGAAAYEVSQDLAEEFVGEFGPFAVPAHRHLDLSACIVASLEGAGMPADNVADCGLCTATETGRFFSHRAEHGRTGRHAAVAFMRG